MTSEEADENETTCEYHYSLSSEEENNAMSRVITYCDFSYDLKSSLSNILDADYGFLEKLSCVLTDRQYQSLRQFKGYHRNDKLMEIVHLLPQDDFLEALRETGQQHIVNFIKDDGTQLDISETCWPLTEQQRNKLRINRYQLANMMDTECLLPALYSSHSITELHFKYVQNEKTNDRNLCLLEILSKRSQADYLSFVSALEGTGQSHVASILSEGGGVAVVCALLVESDLESEVVAKFPRWWARASEEKRQQLIDLIGSDMELIDIRESCSIAVYIHCKTMSAIQRLVTGLKDGTLKSAVGEMFSTILDGRLVEIGELDFYESSYNSCLHFFFKSSGFYKKFAVCDPHDVTDEMEQRKGSPAIKDLPVELLETVLVKGIVLVVKHLMTLSTDADILAATMMLMVCQHWRRVFKNRPFIEQQIKETLNHVYRPLRRRIGSYRKSLFETEKDGSMFEVRGVATLDNKLFAVSRNSSAVSVFELKSFTHLQSIEVKGLFNDPHDIATCEVTRRIYIADCGNRSVWRIDWSWSSPHATAAVTEDSTPADKFIDCDGYEPWTLSTNGRRQQLLVTGRDIDNSLYVYDVDGKLSRRIELSTEVDDDGIEWRNYTQHAVQATTGDSYFVCRIGSFQRQQRTHAEVAEYNSAGQRLRSYCRGPRGEGPQQVSWPVHMSLIGDGRLLVADYEARRVLLLDTELKLERVLFSKKELNADDDDVESKPCRLCYNSQAGLLCVGTNKGRVNVFQIC